MILNSGFEPDADAAAAAVWIHQQEELFGKSPPTVATVIAEVPSGVA